MRAFCLGLALVVYSAQMAAASCGTIQQACQTDMGEYHIALPETVRPDMPVLVFLHGFGGSAKGTMGNQRLVQPMLARGWTVIAPQGLRRNGDGPPSWNFFPGWAGRDEPAFLASVIADAAARFGVSSSHVMLGGFSAGAFMVSYLACTAPTSFAAYAPVSGGFWRPQPDACAGPVKMLQTHGWADTTVPLEGRKLRGGAFQQGDIFAGLEVWRAANGCDDQKPSGFASTGPFLRRYWSGCAKGSALEFVLFPGGHTVPAGWSDLAMDWFEQVTAGK